MKFKFMALQTMKTLSLVAVLAAASSSVDAQRFGGYFYTGQQTITMANQSRVCKVYGYDFAKFNPSVSKIVDVQVAKTGACQSAGAKWNGDCCKVSYTNNAATNRGQQAAPTRQRQQAPATQQRRRTR